MKLETLIRLAQTYRPETYLGKRNTPIGFVIDNNEYTELYPAHIDYKWRAVCVFPGGAKSESVFKTVKEAREWALVQTLYQSNPKDVQGAKGELNADG